MERNLIVTIIMNSSLIALLLLCYSYGRRKRKRKNNREIVDFSCDIKPYRQWHIHDRIDLYDVLTRSPEPYDGFQHQKTEKISQWCLST